MGGWRGLGVLFCWIVGLLMLDKNHIDLSSPFLLRKEKKKSFTYPSPLSPHSSSHSPPYSSSFGTHTSSFREENDSDLFAILSPLTIPENEFSEYGPSERAYPVSFREMMSFLGLWKKRKGKGKEREKEMIFFFWGQEREGKS